ncbi:MAG: hypothetical protein RIR16_912 [Actinomycetota bacterium]
MRLDVALVDRSLARSRKHAVELIEADRVFLDSKIARKAAQNVTEDSKISVLESNDYVSRAGHKLAKALDVFGELDPRDKTALDVGASTGGFTDVLLRRGIAKVIALDVGHDQLVPELRKNPKVSCIEGFNARELSPETLAKALGVTVESLPNIELVVGDLSFISLTLVLEPILKVAPNAEYVLLIKPQFEVGKQSLSANGLVNDHRLRAFAINQVVDEAIRLGLGIRGLALSELPGTHGNLEYLLWISKNEPRNKSQWENRIAQIAKETK